MKRAFAILFLSLYLYNFVGYILLFSFLQFRVRAEMKEKIKASVPANEMVLLTFASAAIGQGSHTLQWLDDHEFRYDGNLYDIVYSYTLGDTTYFFCLNDAQEEKLFEHLDLQVQRQLGNSGQLEKFDAFKNVFMNSYPAAAVTFPGPHVCGLLPLRFTEDYRSVDPDSPFHPPRSSST